MSRVVIGLIVIGWCIPAFAQGDVLSQLREDVLYARYDEAESAAQSALSRTDLNALQYNEVLELLATAQLANRDENGARATMRTLFARDPGHRILQRDASPPVVAAFARAQEEHVAPLRIPLQIDSTWLGSNPDLGNAVRVQVRGTEHANAIDEIRLYYRDSPQSPFVRVLFNHAGAGVWTAEIPANPSRVSVEFHIEALAPSRFVLSRQGSEQTPLRRDTPWPTTAAEQGDNAWIWGLAIGAVALVGAGIAVGVVLAQPGPEQGTLGTLVLTRM